MERRFSLQRGKWLVPMCPLSSCSTDNIPEQPDIILYVAKCLKEPNIIIINIQDNQEDRLLAITINGVCSHNTKQASSYIIHEHFHTIKYHCGLYNQMTSWSWIGIPKRWIIKVWSCNNSFENSPLTDPTSKKKWTFLLSGWSVDMSCDKIN